MISAKDYAIDTFDLAQWNVLRAIVKLKPDDFRHQISPNFNSIQWMLGHLLWHMDHIFNLQCQGSSKLTKEEREYFKSRPEGADDREFPFSLKRLIDTFLEVSESAFQYLRELPDEEYHKPPAKSAKKDDETIYESLQRISLHFLGHTGQFYLIKRDLGKGGYFVIGVRKKGRDDSRKKWLTWWNKTKDEFDV